MVAILSRGRWVNGDLYMIVAAPYGIAECNVGILRRGNQLRLIVISKGKQDATLASSGVKIPVNVKMSASMGSSIIQSRSWHEDSGSNEPEQWAHKVAAKVVSNDRFAFDIVSYC